MKNLKKLQKKDLKKITGGINCPGGNICYRNGKPYCAAYDGCGGGNQP
ncbi:bacteriocin [Chryseobacterium sp. SSA4.19]|jgi:bacteriocin-like protein|nr:bacteriocin [Chryseobacterium sp. SSA4.19]MCJ8153143.1 bacteriocin [Chryseobacterium sp. SSA4.19]